MRLKEYISKDLVFVVPESIHKASFLEALATGVKAQFPEIDRDTLFDNLRARENQASTGIGQGVAIPHTTLEGIEKTVCIIAKSPNGVDFESIDGAPVHIAFLLLSPPGQVGKQLRILARIARLASQKELVPRILAAKESVDIYTIIEKEDDLHV